MSKSLSKNNKKKWMVVYFGGDNGTEYVSEDDYQLLCSAVTKTIPMIKLRDGRVLSTSIQRLVKNPKWIDEDRIEDLKKERLIWEEYQKLKKSGKFNQFEDFLKWKKK